LNSNVLYFDCFSGASGDMILGALVDAGVPIEVVRDALTGLNLDGWSIDADEVMKAGLRATKVSVATDETEAPERELADIRAILGSSELPERVRERSLHAFSRLAHAEAKVHGKGPEEVHFHEVGALDAIVDVVGSMIALEHLGPALIVTSPIAVGRGFVESAHGRWPIPGPAVTELLQGVDILEEGDGELTTPTGAAILATVTDRFGPLPAMRLEKTGYGAGMRERPTPNVLRVLIGTAENADVGRRDLVIETNLDDMSPELLPYAIERTIEAGASDAWASPILMKKDRSAMTLSVLVMRDRLDAVLDAIYRETTTLGVRIREVQKDELERGYESVDVAGHPIRLKLGYRGGRVISVSPEFEDAQKVARITGLPLKEIYRRALSQHADD
jgi:uncharacterized protein (TIGR00299 family) protein